MNCGGIRNRLTICLTFLLTILIFTPMSHLQKKTFWSTFCTPQSHPAMHPFYFSVTAPLWHILHNLQTALLLYIHQTTPNFRFIRLAVHVGYHSQHSSCQSVPSGEVGAGLIWIPWSLGLLHFILRTFATQALFINRCVRVQKKGGKTNKC